MTKAVVLELMLENETGDSRPTMVLAVLRGALLDLLATGDLERTTAAVRAIVSPPAR